MKSSSSDMAADSMGYRSVGNGEGASFKQPICRRDADGVVALCLLGREQAYLEIEASVESLCIVSVR